MSNSADIHEKLGDMHGLNQTHSGQQAVEPWQIVRASMVEQAGDDNPSRVARNILHALRNAGFTVSRTHGPPFRFRRYVHGEERAEGVAIEHETTLESAMRRAAQICPITDGTVLVLDVPTAPSTAAGEREKLREALLIFQNHGCPMCGGDCGSANPPVSSCPMQEARAALATPPAQEGNPFREALHDAYIASDGGVTWHDDDPKKTLGEIVAWMSHFVDAVTTVPPADVPWEEKAAQWADKRAAALAAQEGGGGGERVTAAKLMCAFERAADQRGGYASEGAVVNGVRLFVIDGSFDMEEIAREVLRAAQEGTGNG